MLVNLLIAFLLLVANAFFVAAEFALVKLKVFRVDALASSGSKSALLTQRIHRHLEPYLAACQLGITMASLGLGWVGEPTVAAILQPLLSPLDLPDKVVHTIAFLTGFIVFSSLHIVVGEQVPKTLAIRKPEPVSLWIAYPLRGFYLMIFPLNWLLNAASATILRAMGVAEAPHVDVLSGEEIQGLIDTSEEHGNIEAQKATMLRNLFAFDSRTVEEIMVPRGKVAYVDLQDPWEKQRETFSKIQHSRFPVVEGDGQELRGILLAKDLYHQVLMDEGEPIQSVEPLIRDAMVVPESQCIGVLFERMRSSRQQMAVVVDEYGAFAGVVTMEDLLEEIVGEIADELDQRADTNILTEMDGYYQAEGWTQLTDLERALSIEFDEDLDANTLSGLFMQRLSRVPVEGDLVHELGYRFLVESMAGHRVDRVRIEAMQSPESAVDPAEAKGPADTAADAPRKPEAAEGESAG